MSGSPPTTRAITAAVALLAVACGSTPSGTVSTSVEVRDGHELLQVTVRTTPETAVSVNGPGESRGCSGPLDGTVSYCTIVLDGVAERAPTYRVTMTIARPRLAGIPVGSPGHAEQELRVERPLGATWSAARGRAVLTGMGGELALEASGEVVLSGAPDGTLVAIGSQQAAVAGGQARVALDVDPATFSALVSTGAPSRVDIAGATIAAGGAPTPIALQVDPAALRAALVARAREVSRPAPELARGGALLWVSSEGQTELHGEARSLADLRYVALEQASESSRGSCGPYSQTLSAAGGSRLARVARDLEVWIVDRSTGAELARRRFPGLPPRCPSIVGLDQRSVVGELDLDAARAWLLATRPPG